MEPTAHPQPELAVQVMRSTAAERTSFAWNRTALVWAGAGAAVTRYFLRSSHWDQRAGVGIAMILCGVAMWVFGHWHYRRRHAALLDGRVEPFTGSGLGWITAGLCLTLLAAVVIEIVDLASGP